ncbi:MAG: hypothetical protein JNM93_06260 [Bacteriovoracaceae bacterium]|nr:hypothetical protein [Bacteriovoracaceae bacterium]
MKKFLLCFVVFSFVQALANENFEKFYKDKQSLSSEVYSDILKDRVVADATVRDNDKEDWQDLDTFVTGLHTKSCERSLRKISLYEKYKDFIDYVSESSYHEKTEQVHLALEHSLLPVKMVLEFKLPRLRGPGVYPFIFDNGFFKGLKGNIYIENYQDRCLYLIKAYWKGKSTKFPNIVIEAFTKTLLQVGMEKIFRVSQF